uniref:winged helix-turn-helix domain-containing protein n=1 Tax=Aquibium sp. A9E412 TaxID=2976767 RepID=UPI00339DA83D
MTAVSRNTYCKWVVNALRALGPSRPENVYRWIKANEPVPASELNGTTSDGENLFKKNVRWARFTLYNDGTVTSPSYGVWALR